MLGDNCPQGCNVPLMRSRDKKALVCLGCDTDFLAEAASKPAPLTTKQGEGVSVSSSDLTMVVDSKIAWIASEIARTSSIAELSSLVDLASKLIALKNSLYSVSERSAYSTCQIRNDIS